jgi:chromosome segregation ATPase
MATAGDTGVSASTLEALERDFEDVIRDLGGEDNLERFRLEYEKLHRALKKSHESERRLVKKCQELSQEIMANAAKIQSAIKMSQNDHNTIEAFKAEIEKAWKMVDGAHEKETRAKTTIQELKKEAATLAALVEKGSALTHGQELSLAQLMDENKSLQEEREHLSNKIQQLTRDINEKSELQMQLDQNVRVRDDELRKVTAKLADLRRDFEREVKSKDRADGQAKELMQVLQARNNEAEMRGTSLKEKTEKIGKLDLAIRDGEARKNELITELQNLETSKSQLQTALNDLEKTSFDNAKKVGALEAEIKKREESITQIRYDEQKAQKTKDQRLKQLKKVAQERDDIKKEHEMLQRQIAGLEKEIEAVRKERLRAEADLGVVATDKVKVDDKARKERDDQGKIEARIDEMKGLRLTLADELDNLKRDITHKTSEVLRLEGERERFAELASEANVKHEGSKQEEKIARMRIGDLEKQIEEAGKELVGQQSKYEQVRSDRNLYSKNLIEAQDEISEMKQKFKIMDHQIDQLKEELAMKEKKHFEADTNYKSLKEKLSKLRKKINTLMESYKEATSRSESLSQEIKQLTKVINTCDGDLSAQQEEFLAVTNQRDILGTQLIRRNDELALLYEKIRIQQSTLSRGEVQYRDRLVDIRMLRLKISELKRNVHMAQVRVKNIDELKAHTATLTRQLALERTKVQALSEELENPQNFLRWRKLEGSDPKPAEKVQKLQALQKRLITVTEQCVEKDILISEKDKLYVELKTILARQPGPEVAEQLNIYQEDLRRLNTQMKCLASELNMSASQSSEYKYEVERLNRTLQEAKKQRFETKMNHQMLLRERKTVHGATV